MRMARILTRSMGLNIPTFGEGGKNLRSAIAKNLLNKSKISGSYVSVFKDVNIEIKQGDRVALVGPNGAGKTSLLRLFSGIYFPTEGDLKVEGTVRSLISLGSGLDPNLTGLENINRLCLLCDHDWTNINEVSQEIADFSDLREFLEMPVRTYSAGMRLRLLSGLVFSEDAEILLIDEFFGAGDAKFTEKVSKRMELQVNKAKIVVIASHNKSIIKEYCQRAFCIEAGKVFEVDVASV